MLSRFGSPRRVQGLGSLIKRVGTCLASSHASGGRSSELNLSETASSGARFPVGLCCLPLIRCLRLHSESLAEFCVKGSDVRTTGQLTWNVFIYYLQ